MKLPLQPSQLSKNNMKILKLMKFNALSKILKMRNRLTQLLQLSKMNLFLSLMQSQIKPSASRPARAISSAWSPSWWNSSPWGKCWGKCTWSRQCLCRAQPRDCNCCLPSCSSAKSSASSASAILQATTVLKGEFVCSKSIPLSQILRKGSKDL